MIFHDKETKTEIEIERDTIQCVTQDKTDTVILTADGKTHRVKENFLQAIRMIEK